MWFDAKHYSGKTYVISATSETVTDLKTEIASETVGFFNQDATELVMIDLIKQSALSLSRFQAPVVET